MRVERALVGLAPRTRVRRVLRITEGAWSRAARGRTLLPDRYFIRYGYRSRTVPEYSSQPAIEDVVWQPDVYPEAARIAELLSCRRIVDVGCGNGRKLAALQSRFDIVGIDHGPNLERCRVEYPSGIWLDHDLESDEPLPIADASLSESIVVCADVVEHLGRPERLLRSLRRALDFAPCVVLSTPERELTWGAAHRGPPPNPAHVREWALAELAPFLRAEGFAYGVLTLTRSRDRFPARNTILARLFADGEQMEHGLR